MARRFRSWWPKVKKRPVIVTAIIVAFVAVVVFIFAVNTFGWDWTGFNGGYGQVTTHTAGKDTVVPPTRTLWDWLQLLIIPLVLAIGGLWFSQIQKDRELKAAELRVQTEREAAENRAQTEREIAQDNQQETTLQEYIDKMSELLLDEELCKPTAKEEARKIARVRTLTVLPRLNGKRKGTVLQFLYEAQLINKGEKVVDLSSADLRKANLMGTNLTKSDLSGTILTGSNLGGANLTEVDLCKADLLGSKLMLANLVGANLKEAYISLSISETDLSHTNLNEANLRNADLSRACLIGANLTKANLSGAILVGTKLTGGKLNNADLRGAKVTEEQLNSAESLEGAIMPDGSIHP